MTTTHFPEPTDFPMFLYLYVGTWNLSGRLPTFHRVVTLERLRVSPPTVGKLFCSFRNRMRLKINWLFPKI